MRAVAGPRRRRPGARAVDQKAVAKRHPAQAKRLLLARTVALARPRPHRRMRPFSHRAHASTARTMSTIEPRGEVDVRYGGALVRAVNSGIASGRDISR